MKNLRLKKWVKVVGIIIIAILFEIICWKAMWNTKSQIDKCMEEGNSRYVCEQRIK